MGLNMEHIGHILPVHGYKVKLSRSLTTDYIPSLIHLYQPLIGKDAITLYLTLLEERTIQADHIFTHHMLMNQLDMPLNDLFKARKRLEGIGLLQTFKADEEQHVYFTYVIEPPFRPDEFFNDFMLTELLHHQLGEAKFNILKRHYKDGGQVAAGENVTAAFQDVFQTVTPKQAVNPTIERKAKQAEVVPTEQVDFTVLEQSLSNMMINPKQVLTERLKQIIVQLMTLYDLPLFEIEKALQWALTEENQVDIEQLKLACHDLFRKKHKVVQPKLMPKQAEERVYLDENEPNISDVERLIRRFEKISPKQLLEDLSKGKQADEKDLQLVRDIMTNQGLTAPVMNVLIHFVMLQQDMRLPQNYTRKIASHWSRLGFETAREAMTFAQEGNQNSQQKYGNRRSYQAKNREVIPDWFKERKKEVKIEQKETIDQKTDDVDEKEREQMLALLRQHSNKS